MDEKRWKREREGEREGGERERERDAVEWPTEKGRYGTSQGVWENYAEFDKRRGFRCPQLRRRWPSFELLAGNKNTLQRAQPSRKGLFVRSTKPIGLLLRNDLHAEGLGP